MVIMNYCCLKRLFRCKKTNLFLIVDPYILETLDNP